MIRKKSAFLGMSDLNTWKKACKSCIADNNIVFSIRYHSLGSADKKRLEDDEDKLLSTMLYNLIAFMVMMSVSMAEIKKKVPTFFHTLKLFRLLKMLPVSFSFQKLIQTFYREQAIFLLRVTSLVAYFTLFLHVKVHLSHIIGKMFPRSQSSNPKSSWLKPNIIWSLKKEKWLKKEEPLAYL